MRYIRLLLTCSGFLAAAPAPATLPAMPRAVYESAERMNAPLEPLVRNLRVVPVWRPDGSGFWYRSETADGVQWTAVDPQRRSKSAAFDSAKLAESISQVVGSRVKSTELALEDLEFLGAGDEIRFTVGKHVVTCRLPSQTCTATATPDSDRGALPSPDGTRALFRRDNDLWLRDLRSGAERQLTVDGEPYFAWGKYPDAGYLRVLTASRGQPLPLAGVSWSPNSRHVLISRVDERALPDYWFLQSAPSDGSRRPKPISVRVALASDAIEPSVEVAMLDVDTGTRVRLPVGARGVEPAFALWSPDGQRALVWRAATFPSDVELFELSTAGRARTVLTERSATFVSLGALESDAPSVHFLATRNEVIWYSQRDGSGRLYLISLSNGQVRRAISPADVNVTALLKVDERAGTVWFAAAGAQANPYHRDLYVGSLAGTPARRVTPGGGDHEFASRPSPAGEAFFRARGLKLPREPELISPNGRWFVDTVSTVDQAPRSVLRSATGREIMVLETADIGRLVAAGYQRPEPFVAKAADGRTDLYGVLVKPPGFDPTRTYPVIDAIYNGPQVVTTPHSFSAGLGGRSGQPFAQLGFVVVVVDSRGTPLRSKAFHDYVAGNLQEFGLEDHVAVLKQLGASRPWLDLSRVGVSGHSFGGYAAMKAILGYPDVFKAASASAGPYDYAGVNAIGGLLPPPRFADGGAQPRSPGDVPLNWGAIDLTKQAANLKGRLQLAYGELDENVYPALAVRMVDALIAANKDFELVYVPNRGHSYGREPYAVRRRWDFFVRTLLEQEPPSEYRFGGGGRAAGSQ
jgi:dipeptidyl-peptidase-4